MSNAIAVGPKVCSGCDRPMVPKGAPRDGKPHEMGTTGECDACYRRARHKPTAKPGTLGGVLNPNTIGGERTLLARSCKTCHSFLQAADFYRRSWGYESNCIACYRREHMKTRPRRTPVLCGAVGILIAKTCGKCGEFKPAEAFMALARGGHLGTCEECVWKPMPEILQAAISETRQSARRHGYQWTGPELEIAARDDLSVKEAALMLGRSFYAVETARKKLRAGDPKTTWLAGLPKAERQESGRTTDHHRTP